MKVSILVAMAANGVIGQDNGLPWKLSADLKRFKARTLGHHLLMGRKTYESIGHPLPGRTTMVLSRGAPSLPEGVELASSLEEALETARSRGETEAFVAGGAEVYRGALGLADCLYLTRLENPFEGDTRFPPWSPEDWRLTAVETCPNRPGEPEAVFETWLRRSSNEANPGGSGR